MTVGLLSQLEHDEVAEVHTTDESIPTTPQRRKSTQLCIALRRGRDVIGLQTASRRGCGESFGNREHRIARGMAQPASLIVEHARVREELEWHSRLKSEFVATMSHELRTPLNVALGYLDLVLDGEFGCLTTDQDRVLQCARKSARKLVSLVDSTLDLSRLEKGMAELEVRSFRLADIADEIRDEMRDECSRPGLVVTFDIPRELSLCTDNVKLKVVVRNIVDNALKFTRSGSVKVSATKREGGTVISVTDTGVGISAEVLRIIFEPFRQGDSSTTRRFDGVGLGLYVVRRLLDVLGGTISVESEVEHGTTFRISVPDLLPPEAKSPTVRCGQA
jgi:signal transduction histidine kinase